MPSSSDPYRTSSARDHEPDPEARIWGVWRTVLEEFPYAGNARLFETGWVTPFGVEPKTRAEAEVFAARVQQAMDPQSVRYEARVLA